MTIRMHYIYIYACDGIYVVDYGLAPEVQYPHSLEQVYTVYQWIRKGGLGFTPSSIAAFGESAGTDDPHDISIYVSIYRSIYLSIDR